MNCTIHYDPIKYFRNKLPDLDVMFRRLVGTSYGDYSGVWDCKISDSGLDSYLAVL